ncbi:hypothetical protein BDV19DRAFT_179686 [Aspergillus venezuelensis]
MLIVLSLHLSLPLLYVILCLCIPSCTTTPAAVLARARREIADGIISNRVISLDFWSFVRLVSWHLAAALS